MERYAFLGADGRVLATVADPRYAGDGYAPVSFPEGFDFDAQSDWRLVGGELVRDPPAPEPDPESERAAQEAAAVGILVRALARDIPDADALSVPLLFSEWSESADYATGDVVRHGGGIYRCLQPHASQPSWEPGSAPSLWVRIRAEGGGPQPWEQVVQGVSEPYSKGDRVTHKGAVWVSDIDANVWEPGVYGWTRE